MPDGSEHSKQAIHNLKATSFLLKQDEYVDWASTTLFYSALHIVEAVFHNDKNVNVSHTNTHKDRLDALKAVNRYKQIFKQYRPLMNTSLIARYMCDGSGIYRSFDGYISKQNLIDTHVKGLYCRLLKSASNFMEPRAHAEVWQTYQELFLNPSPPNTPTQP